MSYIITENKNLICSKDMVYIMECQTVYTKTSPPRKMTIIVSIYIFKLIT